MEFQSQINMIPEPTSANHVARKQDIDLIVSKITNTEYEALELNNQLSNKTIYFVDSSNGGGQENHQIKFRGVTYSSIVGLDHELLINRIGIGQNGESFHLDEDMYNFLRAEYLGTPLTPVNMSPLDGEIDIYKFPEFVGSEYVSPKNVPMLGLWIRIGLTEDIESNIVIEDYIETQKTNARCHNFESIIQTSTTYYWQIRYVDDDGRIGPYSIPTSFTTLSVFDTPVIEIPTILFPAEGTKISPIDPLLISTPFTMLDGADSHSSSDWEFASDQNFQNLLASSYNDTNNKTSITFSLDLSGVNGVYSRVKHNGVTKVSDWSPRRHAYLREFYDGYTIGIGITESGSIKLIDETGAQVQVRGDYYNRHPLWQFSETIILNNYMRSILETHVRCDSGEGGFKYRYWVSPSEFDGSIIHPAFAQTNGLLFLGSYMNGNGSDPAWAGESTNGAGNISEVGSKPNVRAVPMGAGYTNRYTVCNSLNTEADSDHVGWHLMSIYDWALLTLLMTIELKTLNLSSYMVSGGDRNTLNSAISIKYRGISAPMLVSKIPDMNNTYSSYNASLILLGFGGQGTHTNINIGSPYDLQTYKTFLRTAIDDSDSNKYVQELIDDIDEDLGPLLLLFLGKTFSSTIDNTLGVTMYCRNSNGNVDTIATSNRGNSFITGVGYANGRNQYYARLCKWAK